MPPHSSTVNLRRHPRTDCPDAGSRDERDRQRRTTVREGSYALSADSGAVCALDAIFT
jgi:hypothetical protein